ncbi:N-terminal fungal transcription regulatory domain-containing protein [Dactylonectria estremocensis]|uniref:N-terminal fungal transcription regulatory domain-containing protein n=1 Tax=Dactylonectria estremocensis TaxID=1079267 RepID=A0A9P9IL07_9HYPO|nr:N-terminal fungal transcription regulatory domain-containing protein [Dactylonectria estremocensis]
MKVRKPTVCQNCRLRKLGCDGNIPACSQCLLRGRACPGYQADLIFRDPLMPRPGPSGRSGTNKMIKRMKPSNKSINTAHAAQTIATQRPTLVTRALSWPLSDIISLCAQNFVPESELVLSSSNPAVSQSRICGSWIEVLPSLIEKEEHQYLLHSAIKALGVSILARGRDGRAPVSDALEAQGGALQALQDAIRHCAAPCFNALAAAMMCLYISEIMVPSSCTGRAVHANGIRDLIQLHGPQFYNSGISHKLFVGFRPLLILDGFHTRKSSFLSSLDWRNEPFRIIPTTPLQELMNEASILPSLLERLDNSKTESPTKKQSIAEDSIAQFIEMLNILHTWHQRTLSDPSQNFWWKPSPTGQGNCLWFSSISTANCLTHFWAFWILCVTQIRQLRAKHPSLMGAPTEVNGEPPESEAITQRLVEMANWIIQSVEFLMQDKMKFFGIASATFPIQTACGFLNADVVGGDVLDDWGHGNVLRSILQNGYRDFIWPVMTTMA